MADISQIKLPNGDIFDLVDGSKSTATNWVNGSQAGSVRTTGSTEEGSSWSSYIIGVYAIAEGRNTKANGPYSHAEGNGAQASGVASHAEGGGIAKGDYSHAEGSNTSANGSHSHAEGLSSMASGRYSHAQNRDTIAQRQSQTVIGEYNIADTGGTGVTTRGNYAFIIGNGSQSTRSNALTIDWSGNEWLAGKLTLGTAGTESMDVATIGQLPTKTSDLTNDSGFITSDSDEKLKLEAVANGIYYPIVGKDAAASVRQYDTTGLSYQFSNGTTTSTGIAELILGNNIGQGTAGNKEGRIKLFGPFSGSVELYASTSTQNRLIKFPNQDGTVALTSDIPSTIVTSVATGAGLTGGTITSSGTIKANLNSETSLGTIGTTNKLYAVGIDSNGKLAVSVPWADSSSYIVTVTEHWGYETTDATYTWDKTFAEIKSAIDAKKDVTLYKLSSWEEEDGSIEEDPIKYKYEFSSYYPAEHNEDLDWILFANVNHASYSISASQIVLYSDGSTEVQDGDSYIYMATDEELGLVKSWYYHHATASGITSGHDSRVITVNPLTTTTGRYYGIESDINGRMFVNVPWEANVDPGVTKITTTAGIHSVITNATGAVSFNVPTKTSHLTNDSGYVTSSGVTSITLKAGSGISLDTDNTAITTTGTRTISHADTSSQASSSNSGRTYIQSITLDDYGHVTGISTAKESVVNTDTKLQVAAVTSGTQYYPIVGTGTSARVRQYDTTGFKYKGTNGTTSAIGSAILELGNSTASGTENNKQAQLIMYGSNAKKATITLAAPSADVALALPTSSGTLALTSQIPSISVIQKTTTGTNIADVTVNGTTTQLFAPNGGGGDHEDLTQAEYDALTEAEKMDGTVYFITDSDPAPSSLLNFFYPVGSYYETSDTTFDPNVSMGGIWELETEGLVHIGSGRNYVVGDTGGEAAHILTVEEMPKHNHDSSQNSYGFTYIGASSGTTYGAWFGNGAYKTGFTGGGQAHNIMQPYIVVNRWHRIA